MKCTAQSKRTGQQCGGNAVPGMTVCHWHGGKTPTGIASPHFRTGRHSKYLPTRMLQTYEAALTDPRLLELHAEIALLDSRLAELLGKVDTGESGALWEALGAAYRDLQRARNDAKAFAVALTVLGGLITQGAGDAAAWAEIARLVQDRRRLVESERKRQVEMQQMVSIQQGLALVAALADSVKRHVSDPRILGAIQTDLARLLTADAGRVVDADYHDAGD